MLNKLRQFLYGLWGHKWEYYWLDDFDQGGLGWILDFNIPCSRCGAKPFIKRGKRL